LHLAELGAYLETQLQTEAIPGGIGTFYIFKDESRRQQFLPTASAAARSKPWSHKKAVLSRTVLSARVSAFHYFRMAAVSWVPRRALAC
jgi:hypothetical protein